MDSREERERLKEEYKEHFRSLRDAKNRFTESLRLNKIQSALNDMGVNDIMDTMGEMVDTVRHKIAEAEAKLDLAIESYSEEQQLAEAEEEMAKMDANAKAKETIQKIKMEMGQIQEELEKEASELKSHKTLGRKTGIEYPQSEAPSGVSKTIGKK